MADQSSVPTGAASDTTTSASILDFRLSLDDLQVTGHDLVRPECVLALRDGTLLTSDGRGGVTRIAPDGTQTRLGEVGGEPNGLALAPDGSIYIANIALGVVQRLFPDGHVETFLGELNGTPLTCANFVFLDSKQRLWCAFSTREAIWWPAAAHPRPDGFIVLVDERGLRIVADGIYFTNEIRLDADERYLYVAETMKARMLRFPVNADGSLGEREVFGPDGLGMGAYVDGFAFDAEGNVWVTTVTRNGLVIITADGSDAHVVFEDASDDLLRSFQQRIAEGMAEPRDMAAAMGKRLRFPTSVAFGGPDLRTVYLGSLAMPHLPTFRSPVPGLPLSHWR